MEKQKNMPEISAEKKESAKGTIRFERFRERKFEIVGSTNPSKRGRYAQLQPR
jgi:hypothetical protein